MLKEKYLKRPSPPVSAQDHPNKIMKGNDEEEYVSKPNKNGIYKWHKLVWKNTAEEYYMQFPENYLNKKFYKYKTTELLNKFKKVASELKKNDILFLEIGWKSVYYFIDFLFCGSICTRIFWHYYYCITNSWRHHHCQFRVFAAQWTVQ